MSPQKCNILESVSLFFKNYANFKGRSTRSEYWWLMLAASIFSGVMGALYGVMTAAVGIANMKWAVILLSVIVFGLIVPSLSLSVRRMHDIGKSGKWILISAVPVVGIFIFLYLTIKESDGQNEYGDSADELSFF